MFSFVSFEVFQLYPKYYILNIYQLHTKLYTMDESKRVYLGLTHIPFGDSV